jgi:TrmH family RNA methyltransferase
MIKITAKTNDRIKHLKKLLDDKSYRYEQKLFAVEGLRALEGIPEVQELFIREDAEGPGVRSLKAYSVANSVFDGVSSTEHSQGVIAVTKLNLLSAGAVKNTGRYVLLDRLQDPGNMGTIIRAACAFGASGVIITPGCADPFSPKVVRAAASALWKLDIISIAGVEELKAFHLIAADLEGETLSGFKWPESFVLAIGNEAQGLSPQIKSASAQRLRIPISGSINSLNAAVSAGILLYSSFKGE